MNWTAMTYEDPQTIEVTIETKSNERIWLVVTDFENSRKKFTERSMLINGLQKLQVMMPVCPKKIRISVYNGKSGNTKSDSSFKVKSIERLSLKQRLNVIGQNTKIRSFVKFAQNICYYLQELKPGLYGSDDKQFFIELLPQITNNDGRILNTPARINKDTGIIQVSIASFYTMTIPEMMAILLHEFSHFNISDDIDNESEADLNGLLIYLALGYPRQEAMEAWAGVFEKADTLQNKQRYAIIKKFIEDFENNKI